MHLGEVAKVYPEIQRLGGEVLVVSFTPPPRVAAYVEKYPQPFPVVSDPTLAAYKGFDLGRTSVAAMLRPGVLIRFVKLLFRGWWPTKPGKGDDILQLGGDFVLDKAGRLIYAHPSAEPMSRPTNAALLAALEKAHQVAG